MTRNEWMNQVNNNPKWDRPMSWPTTRVSQTPQPKWVDSRVYNDQKELIKGVNLLDKEQPKQDKGQPKSVRSLDVDVELVSQTWQRARRPWGPGRRALLLLLLDWTSSWLLACFLALCAFCLEKFEKRERDREKREEIRDVLWGRREKREDVNCAGRGTSASAVQLGQGQSARECKRANKEDVRLGEKRRCDREETEEERGS